MDKSWINKNRASMEYLNGVQEFLNYAFQNSADTLERILCPCVKCVNSFWLRWQEIEEHLICDHGFDPHYTIWVYHGEIMPINSPSRETQFDHVAGNAHEGINTFVHETLGVDMDTDEVQEEVDEGNQGYPDAETSTTNDNGATKKYKEIMRDANTEVYPGCKKYSILSFTLRFAHLKSMCGMTNKGATMMLEFIQDVLPEGAKVPKNSYETNKIVKKLGCHYEKIDACPKHCMLFWKENANLDFCSVCNTSRWISKEDSDLINPGPSLPTTKIKRRPAKVLRWFPIKERLQRLFMSSKTSESMRWHKEARTDDGLLRHPADSSVWKDFDSKYPEFAKDSRNIRLGLASDGFNPFGNMSLSYSMWPVILMPYNLPPWMCMKESSFILSLLIPGKDQPGNNIDVYLEPLIDELRELWGEGIETYDSYAKETFTLRASLLWTINDFPAYANLSGWSTKGEFACPTCNYDTTSQWLRNSQKWCYMGHRRWLKDDHKYRKAKNSFNGERESRSAPSFLSGTNMLDQINSSALNLPTKRKRGDQVAKNQWKKRSIFFSLPYWQHVMVRHNLDVMHIEKNVCDNIIGTLLNMEGKSKDHYKARMDLVDMGIRPDLHPEENTSGRVKIPRASYFLTNKEKEEFCCHLKKIKVPDGYSSNISRCIDPRQRKIMGLKSHDGHILMQELLGVALRGALPPYISHTLIQVCTLFKAVCSKVLDIDELERLSIKFTHTMCELERIFPPSFFTIMIHLMVHLADEARRCGPVHYRWMYPIERYLHTLKKYVRNKACPEGSIAEAYIANECLTLLARYLDDVETIFTRPLRNNDNKENSSDVSSSNLNLSGRRLGKAKDIELDQLSLNQAHRYVLFNTPEINPYIAKHREVIKRDNHGRRLTENDILKIQSKKFPQWLLEHVALLQAQNNKDLTEKVICLAKGPDNFAREYSGYIINGIRFHTKGLEQRRKTQNSGVVVQVEGDVPYYGELKSVVELSYPDNSNIVLFRCDWVDVHRACKVDEFGFTTVNLSRLIHTGDNVYDDPFVFASQVQQVFYVEDRVNEGWHVAIKTKPRDLFDVQEVMHTHSSLDNDSSVCPDDLPMVRTDVEGEYVDIDG